MRPFKWPVYPGGEWSPRQAQRVLEVNAAFAAALGLELVQLDVSTNQGPKALIVVRCRRHLRAIAPDEACPVCLVESPDPVRLAESAPPRAGVVIVRCADCERLYDDEEQWMICPHGPLWAAPDAYCREHDLVNCPHLRHASDKPKVRGEDGCYGLLTVDDAVLLGGVQVFLDGTPLNETVSADDRWGWAVEYVEGPQGGPILDPERPDEVMTEVRLGKVTFTVGVWNKFTVGVWNKEPTSAD